MDKRYAIHSAPRNMQGDRIIDQDGHWDGDATIQFNVEAVDTMVNPADKVQWIKLELAIDTYYAKALVEALQEKIQAIEKGDDNG